MKKVVFAALVILSAPALADDRETATSFMKCARIADDASRLGCYDRLATDLIELGLGSMAPAAPAAGVAASSPPPPSAGVPQSSPPPMGMPAASPPQQQTVAASPPPAVAAAPPAAVASSPAPTPAVETSAAPAPAPETVAASAPSASQVPQTSAEQSFGSERTEEGQSKELKEIKSRYVGEFEGWTGKTVFQLENGQVWQQTRSGRMMWRADSPMITIKRGFMGGYRLSVEGVNKQVYVKRIK